MEEKEWTIEYIDRARGYTIGYSIDHRCADKHQVFYPYYKNYTDVFDHREDTKCNNCGKKIPSDILKTYIICTTLAAR